MWDYYHKNIPEEPTPNPSQTLAWNANGQNEDYNRHDQDTETREDPKEIGKECRSPIEGIMFGAPRL